MTDRVLALDLAIGTTGWCVLGPGPILVQSGVFSLPDRRTREDRAAWNLRRYRVLSRTVYDLIAGWSPTVVAWEYPDKPRSVWSGGSKGREFHAMSGLAMAEGFLIAALSPMSLKRITQLAVSTTEAKRAAAGQPGASKAQVRRMIEIRTGWTLADLQEDAVDAIAVGLAALRVERTDVPLGISDTLKYSHLNAQAPAPLERPGARHRRSLSFDASR